MKKIAIIMIALVALNFVPALDYNEVRVAAKTHKIVQHAKTRRLINKKLVRKRLIAYGKRKGLTLDSKLTIKTSSWFPPTNIKHYKNNRESVMNSFGCWQLIILTSRKSLNYRFRYLKKKSTS